MALINCPSCGKTVSDKAEKCVHCGISLASASDAPIEAEETAAATTEKKRVDYMQQFNTDEPDIKRKKDKINNLFKFYDKFEWFFIALIIGLGVLAVYLIKTNDLFKSYGVSIFMLFCIFASEAITVMLKYTKGEIIPYIYSLKCSKWISKNNINATQYIQDKYIMYATNGDIDGIAYDLFDFTQGVLFAKDPKSYSKIKKHFIIRTAVTIIFALWVAFVVPFVLPLGLIEMTATNDATIVFIVAIPFLVLLILRIILFYAMGMRDRKCVSRQYAPN